MKTWRHADKSLSMASRLINLLLVLWESATHLGTVGTQGAMAVDTNSRVLAGCKRFFEKFPQAFYKLNGKDLAVVLAFSTINTLIEVAQLVLITVYVVQDRTGDFSKACYGYLAPAFIGFVRFQKPLSLSPSALTSLQFSCKLLSLYVGGGGLIARFAAWDKDSEAFKVVSNIIMSTAGIIDTAFANCLCDYGIIQQSHDDDDKLLLGANICEAGGGAFAIAASLIFQFGVKDKPETPDTSAPLIIMGICHLMDFCSSGVAIGLSKFCTPQSANSTLLEHR